MKQTKAVMGRPSKNYGPRHTVAVMLEAPEWEKMQEIARLLGMKPGTHATELIVDYIRSVDLNKLENQEVLFSKAS